VARVMAEMDPADRVERVRSAVRAKQAAQAPR